MDYPLGVTAYSGGLRDFSGLNPYSNGLPSRGSEAKLTGAKLTGLNPYSNGLPSRG